MWIANPPGGSNLFRRRIANPPKRLTGGWYPLVLASFRRPAGFVIRRLKNDQTYFGSADLQSAAICMLIHAS